MSSYFSEQGLLFDFRRAASAVRFDADVVKFSGAGLKAVDFLIEEKERWLLLEVKDFSTMPDPHKPKKEKMNNEMGTLSSKTLVEKARDSFTIMHLLGYFESSKKPMDYVALIHLSGIFGPNDAVTVLGTFGVTLQKKLAEEIPQRPWKHPYIRESFLMTLEQWNRFFSHYPAIPN